MRHILICSIIFSVGCACVHKNVPPLPSVSQSMPREESNINTTVHNDDSDKIKIKVLNGIIGVINIESSIDEAMANEIQAKFEVLNSVEEVKAVLIEINSGGGSVSDGINISKAIERSPKYTVCLVDGEADSMAFFILQSCQFRIMTKRSLLMVHQPSQRMTSPSKSVDYDNEARYLESLTNALLMHAQLRMAISLEDLQKQVAGNRDWWLDHKAATTAGAVDMVCDSYLEAVAIVTASLLTDDQKHDTTSK